jgi:hypothetical protein
VNCNSNHSLFLRSNGSLVCWDDHGSLKTLQAFDPALDYAHDIYLGPIYETIRDRLRNGVMPFPSHCAKCFCLMTHLPMDDGRHVRERTIETFQIEPSMACQLECPGCIKKTDRKDRVARTPSGHMTLDPDVLFKIVLDFKQAGIRIGKFDLQGHGEPLLNRKIWDMCGFLSVQYPQSVISICTHANAQFAPHMVTSGVSEILFAIDGVDQDSYAPWRVHGNFDRAYQFMHDFSVAAAEHAPHVERVWKYVLFSHNDSDAHLLKAQALARAAKITTLRFVATQLGPASSRIQDACQIPRIDKPVAIVMESYRIDNAQLTASLQALHAAIAEMDLDSARHWADFLCSGTTRLLGTRPDAASAHMDTVRGFLDAIAPLPADRFGQYDAIMARSVAGVAAWLSAQAAPDDSALLTNSPCRSRRTGTKLPRPPKYATVSDARQSLGSVAVDEDWYRRVYPDVGRAVQAGLYASAAAHYRAAGYCEARLPAEPLVEMPYYLKRYRDLAKAYAKGLLADAAEHFIHFGYREGRQPARLPRQSRKRLGVMKPSPPNPPAFYGVPAL